MLHPEKRKTIDFSDSSDEQGYGPIEPGTYLMEVDDIKCEQTSSGHEMWRLRLKVVENCSEKGSKCFDRLPFSSNAMGKTKGTLRRLGISSTECWSVPAEDTFFQHYAHFLIGRRAKVTVEIETYEGKRRNTIPFAGYERVEERADDEGGSDDYAIEM